jgi:hypothetical protein
MPSQSSKMLSQKTQNSNKKKQLHPIFIEFSYFLPSLRGNFTYHTRRGFVFLLSNLRIFKRALCNCDFEVPTEQPKIFATSSCS